MLKGYMLIKGNAEGIHGQRKVGDPCSGTYTVKALFLVVPHFDRRVSWKTCEAK